MITSAPKPGQRTNEPPYKVTEITTYTQICIDAINKKLTKCFDFLFSGCGHQFNNTVNRKTIAQRAAGCPGLRLGCRMDHTKWASNPFSWWTRSWFLPPQSRTWRGWTSWIHGDRMDNWEILWFSWRSTPPGSLYDRCGGTLQAWLEETLFLPYRLNSCLVQVEELKEIVWSWTTKATGDWSSPWDRTPVAPSSSPSPSSLLPSSLRISSFIWMCSISRCRSRSIFFLEGFRGISSWIY